MIRDNEGLEQAVLVCLQCEGEGSYADGVDEAACTTECTRCGGNGWIADIPRIITSRPRPQADGLAAELGFLLEMMQDQIELNPSNYSHDQVCLLNTQAVEIFTVASDLIPRILAALSCGEAATITALLAEVEALKSPTLALCAAALKARERR